MILTYLALAFLGAPLQSAETAQSPSVERAQRPGAPERGSRAERIRGVDGELLGTADDPEAALGGSFSNPFGPAGLTRILPHRVFEMTLQSTGTGWAETFLVGVPTNPLRPAPLLVAFHGYGRTPYDIPYNTTYFQEAMARGWIVLAPMGAHKFNFGVPYAQGNVAAMLDWATTTLLIDPERIYGVGFSMGGGWATSFAARHLDPERARFAALVNHTGTVSLRNVYDNTWDTSLLENPLLFGGSPSQFPFAYAHVSTIDLMPDATIGPDDMARNLERVPVWTFAVRSDPLAYLVAQCSQFHAHLAYQVGGESTVSVDAGAAHSWRTLDETAVLDFLEPQRLTEPDRGESVRLLADRDGSWMALEVEQATPGAFSPFRYTPDLINNRLVLDKAKNLARVRFDPAVLGLQVSTQPFEVMLALDGAAAIDVEVEGYANPPTNVTRTGGGAIWSYDADQDLVILHEPQGIGYVRWSITP